MQSVCRPMFTHSPAFGRLTGWHYAWDEFNTFASGKTLTSIFRTNRVYQHIVRLRMLADEKDAETTFESSIVCYKGKSGSLSYLPCPENPL